MIKPNEFTREQLEQINLKELRLGSWVYIRKDGTFDKGGEFIVRYVPIVLYEEYFRDFKGGGCYPIPLTTEILEACGFQRTVGSGAYVKVISDSDICKEIVSAFVRTDGYKGMRIEYKYTDNESSPTTILDDVKYVHQFQNMIFDRSGKELYIKSLTNGRSIERV